MIGNNTYAHFMASIKCVWKGPRGEEAIFRIKHSSLDDMNVSS